MLALKSALKKFANKVGTIETALASSSVVNNSSSNDGTCSFTFSTELLTTASDGALTKL